MYGLLIYSWNTFEKSITEIEINIKIDNRNVDWSLFIKLQAI